MLTPMTVRIVGNTSAKAKSRSRCERFSRRRDVASTGLVANISLAMPLLPDFVSPGRTEESHSPVRHHIAPDDCPHPAPKRYPLQPHARVRKSEISAHSV